jgi:hypothetical protein
MRAAVSLLIALVVAIAFAALAPATLVDGWLSSRTRDALRLAGAEGTVWHGRGIVSDRDGVFALPVAWRVDPWRAIGGDIAITLVSQPGIAVAQGGVVLNRRNATLDDVRVRLPAQAVRGASPKLVPPLGGTLSLSIPSLRIGDEGRDAAGSANVRWSDARLALADTVVDLGQVHAELKLAGDALRGPIANDGGQVTIAGEVQAGATVAVNLTLAPAPGASQQVSRALAVLGPPDATGAVRITWRGAP